METFKASILEVCVQIEKVGLQRMEQRKLEIEDLTASREEAIEETNAKGQSIGKLKCSRIKNKQLL